jgi:hypothetical protein
MTKLHTELIALADYAMNGEDKKLSVIGIFDRIFVKSLPATHPRMSLVVTIVGEAREEEELRLTLVSPLGKELFNADVKVALGENGKANLISNFEGFPFQEAGRYEFRLEKQGKAVASYPLDVILVKEQNASKAIN